MMPCMPPPPPAPPACTSGADAETLPRVVARPWRCDVRAPRWHRHLSVIRPPAALGLVADPVASLIAALGRLACEWGGPPSAPADPVTSLIAALGCLARE